MLTHFMKIGRNFCRKTWMTFYNIHSSSSERMNRRGRGTGRREVREEGGRRRQEEEEESKGRKEEGRRVTRERREVGREGEWVNPPVSCPVPQEEVGQW